uniref:Uncharacterized protein n=1 Tax=Arion vulgaris TaxID=1028688 RepID=A0A0B7ARF3_9EUPU
MDNNNHSTTTSLTSLHHSITMEEVMEEPTIQPKAMIGGETKLPGCICRFD